MPSETPSEPALTQPVLRIAALPTVIQSQVQVISARILIADDHELVREGIRKVLAVRTDWQICAEAENGREAVELSERHQPNVSILDFSMPELNGLEATRKIRELCPNTEVLVLTMHDTDRLVREILAAGAKAFVMKSDAARLLIHAVEALLQHKPFFTGRVSELVLAGFLDPNERATAPGESLQLTPREREIVQLVAEGKSNKEIADTLTISVKTVETHRAKIMSKLDLRAVADLVRYAIRNGIIQP
jgi:DNA-binding NarL/FixJ family response regulator